MLALLLESLIVACSMLALLLESPCGAACRAAVALSSRQRAHNQARTTRVFVNTDQVPVPPLPHKRQQVPAAPVAEGIVVLVLRVVANLVFSTILWAYWQQCESALDTAAIPVSAVVASVPSTTTPSPAAAAGGIAREGPEGLGAGWRGESRGNHVEGARVQLEVYYTVAIPTAAAAATYAGAAPRGVTEASLLAAVQVAI